MKFYLFIFITFYNILLSQSKKVDSLILVLKNTKNDTTTVKLMNDLAYEIYLRTESVDNDFAAYIDSAIRISERINFSKGNLRARLIAANTYRNIGQIAKAKSYLITALDICKKTNDEDNLFKTINGLGNCFSKEGDFKNASAYYFDALKIVEKKHNKKFFSSIYNSLGNLYYSQGDIQKSISYHLKSLSFNIDIGNKMLQSFSYINLGKSYLKTNKRDSAIFYYNKALIIQTAEGNFVGQGYSYLGIGEVYLKKGLASAALDYFKRAYSFAERSQDAELISGLLNSMGQAYYFLGDLNKSLEFLIKAVAFDEKTAKLPELSSSYFQLSKTYAAKKDFANAYFYFQKHTTIKDSVSNSEVGKKISSLEYNYQIAQDKKISELESEKIRIIHEEEVNTQKTIIWSACIVAAIVSLFSIFIFREYRAKKTANEIISKQKQEVENQKQIIEEKQKEVLDSIHYAKRIQNALLPNEKYITKNLSRLKNGN